MVQIISAALELFARAGGGGSGGGGGDGDGISFLALIGYVPAHGLGAFLRRKLPSESGAASLLAHVITWPLAIIWAIACFAMFGGGFFGFIVQRLIRSPRSTTGADYFSNKNTCYNRSYL